MLQAKVTRGLLLSSIALCASPVWSSEASAQAGEEFGASAAEIVVTAKSRAEKLQDVPLSITALTGEDLRQTQVREVKDLQNVTPNLNIFSGTGRNEPTAWSVRGLASNTADERFQGISFFLDGIALSGQLSSLDMENIERVEVIKGPQSATFGRATYSGAVNFITKEPTGDTITGSVRARGSLSKDTDEASYFFNASVTAPLVRDHLWLSVAGTTLRNGKLADSTDTGGPIGRERSDIITGTLFWRPDSTLSVRLRGHYSHDRDSVPAQLIQQPRDWVEAGVPLVTLPRGQGSFLPAILPDADYNLTADKGRSGTERDRYFASLIVSKEIGDYTLTYRGGYFRSKEHRDNPTFMRASAPGRDPVFGGLIGLSPAVVTLAPIVNSFSDSREEFQNTSHQVELLSPGNQPFRWRLGAYYFWEGNKFDLLTFVTPTNPTGRVSNVSVENLAGFGGFDWDIMPGLTLSGEGRIARESQNYPACATCGIPNFVNGKEVTTNFSPRVTLNYKLTPDNMVYALYSNGVKSGRFSNATPPGQPQTLIFAVPEKLDNYEIGTKNTFFDRRLLLNISGFYNKVSQQQLTSSTPYVVNGATSYVTATRNVGQSDIWGFELETSLRVTPQFTLSGSLGYAKQEFTNADPVILAASSSVGFPPSADGSIIMKGKTQANVPWWNGYVAGEYVVPLEVGDLSIRLDGAYRGKFYGDLANITTIKSSWTINSRIALSTDRFDLALFGRNLNNNMRTTGTGLAGGTTACGFIETNTAFYGTNQQCMHATPRRPREIGVEVGFRF